MKEFIKSLTDEERLALGKYFVDAIDDGTDITISLKEAIQNLLLDSLSYDSEGFYDYIARTAQQVIDGIYESIDEIRKEFDGLVKEFSQDQDNEID